MFVKNAKMIETILIDPRSKDGLTINVSKSVVVKFRKLYKGQQFEYTSRADYSTLGDTQVAEIVAQDFAKSYNEAFHMFIAKSSSISGKREWIEIRKCAIQSRPYNFFFSVIREHTIDIIAVSTVYKKPKKFRPPIRSVHES